MSASCGRVRSMLPAYGLEELSAADREAVREHLRECSDCRAEAASADPSLLFAAMPEESISSAEVASVVSSVRAAIAWKETERRVAESRRRPDGRGRRRAARAAAAAAVAFLTLAVPSGLRSPAPTPRAGASGVVPPVGVSAVAAPAEGAVKTSGGATVYDWNPGAGEPRVVWIVDGSLDI